MTSAEKAQIVLDRVKDSGTGRSITDLGWVSHIRVEIPKVILRLNLPDFAISQRNRLASEIRSELKELDDVEEVQIDPDLHDAMFEVTSLKRGTF